MLARRSSALTTIATLVLLATGGAACAKKDDAAARDSATAAAATGPDTGMAGMDHSKMAGTSRPAAKDADQEFLRMMSDHHEGLIQMMDRAMDKATSATAKADARKLHDKQHQEQDTMVAMLKSSYNEDIDPMVMPNNKAMNDSLQAIQAGPAYDRMMYHQVVVHHQEGVKMIDDFLPRLTNPRVKQMAQKMKDDQTKEIAEFERKMNQAGGQKGG